MSAIRPLRPGDRLGVFFPSSPPPRRGFLAGLRLLEALDLSPLLPPPSPPRRYLAASDVDRLGQILFLLRQGVSVFWAARGGYGALRLLDRLPWELLARQGPLLIGFSDTTALLNAALAKASLKGLHAPLLATLEISSLETLRALREVLFSGALPTLQGSAVQEGEARGTLIGGNLTTFVSLVGTPFIPRAEGAILFLEEVGEAPYRVDRLFRQLHLAGILEKISGLALGNFTFCGEIAWDLILETIPPHLPIIAGLPVGHGPWNFPLLIGHTYRLMTRGGRGFLIPEEE